MEYLIAVFKIRNHTYGFYNLLKSQGIKASIVDTPKIHLVSCGISVKFSKKDLWRVKQLLVSFRGSFVGFFKNENIYL